MKNVGSALLRGLRVLVVEDEPLVAMALVDELEQAGATIVGPAATVESALELILSSPPEAAILDLELQRQLSYPVADLLTGRGIPFILTTGHDTDLLPEPYADVPNSPKPVPAAEVLQMLCERIDSGAYPLPAKPDEQPLQRRPRA